MKVFQASWMLLSKQWNNFSAWLRFQQRRANTFLKSSFCGFKLNFFGCWVAEAPSAFREGSQGNGRARGRSEPGPSRGRPSLRITTQEAPCGQRPGTGLGTGTGTGLGTGTGSGARAAAPAPAPDRMETPLNSCPCWSSRCFIQMNSRSGVGRSASAVSGRKDKGKAVSGWGLVAFCFFF